MVRGRPTAYLKITQKQLINNNGEVEKKSIRKKKTML